MRRCTGRGIKSGGDRTLAPRLCREFFWPIRNNVAEGRSVRLTIVRRKSASADLIGRKGETDERS
jgi:hypothetical protein